MGKSDKSLVTKTVLFCSLAIIAVHLISIFFTKGHFTNGVYILVDAVLTLFLIYGINAAYKNVDTAKDNATRWFIVIITILILLWTGGWGAAGNEQVGQVTPQVQGYKSGVIIENNAALSAAISYALQNGGGTISLPNSYFITVGHILTDSQ
jgi:hypothetical protein